VSETRNIKAMTYFYSMVQNVPILVALRCKTHA